MAVGWCFFDPKCACPGGLTDGTGVCSSMAEDDPNFWKNCQFFLETHPEKKKEALAAIENLTEEEHKERALKSWKKLMKQVHKP